jgi:hypothetical protein
MSRQPRFYRNDYDDARSPSADQQRRALEQVAAALKLLKRTALEHQDLEGGGIYVGTGGIGLMYYHLASRQWLAEAERSRRAEALARSGGDGTAATATTTTVPPAAPIDVPTSQIPPYLAKHTPAHALLLAVHFARDGESVMPRRRSSAASAGGGGGRGGGSSGTGPARVTFLEGYSGLLALEAAAQAAQAALLEAGSGGAAFTAAQKQAAFLRRSSTGGRSSMSSASGAGAGADKPTPAAAAATAAAQQAQRCARALVSYYAEVVRHLPQGECEILYGRAGYLYSLLWAQRELDGGGAGGGQGGGGGGGGPSVAPRASTASDNDNASEQGPLPPALWPRSEASRVVAELVRDIVAAGRQGGAEAAAEAAAQGSPCSPPPLVWRWHGRRYLGAAHGACGILYALLCCWPAVRAAGCADEVRAGVDGVLALQQREGSGGGVGGGNLPASLPDGPEGWSTWAGGSDRLVQWCHGAPGFVLLMSKAHEVFCCGGGDDGGGGAAAPSRSPSSSPYLSAALAAADVIWRRGLLTKGAGSLCHGPSGNGYAFLALWRLTRDLLHLRRARWFAVHAASRLSPDVDEEQGGYDVADRPASLYEGAAGGVCFAADALLWPDVGMMPGGELLAAAGAVGGGFGF